MSLLDLRTWTLRRRIVALCITVGVLLSALGVFAAITAAQNNRQLDDVLNRASPMRAAGEALNTAYVDQETGIRGFAITGDEGNLRPYTQGVADEQRLITRIEGYLHPEDGDIRAALAEVQQRSAACPSEYALRLPSSPLIA